jgi:lipoprotein-anchoring transpeptidase ErfK/SrfK
VTVLAALTTLAVLAGCGSAAPSTRQPAPSPTSASSTPRPTPSGPTARATSTVASSTGRPEAARPAAATVASTPCARNHKPKTVLVSVRKQHVWMCAGHQVAYSTAVTTGAVSLPYDSTPTGTFQIQAIERNQVLSLLSGAQYTVKYWIPFDAPLFGFHDSPWQKMAYGSQKYRTKGSHGCIHTPLGALKFLAHWASVGTTVRIKG